MQKYAEMQIVISVDDLYLRESLPMRSALGKATNCVTRSARSIAEESSPREEP